MVHFVVLYSSDRGIYYLDSLATLTLLESSSFSIKNGYLVWILVFLDISGMLS
jgi:hypothetical protein